LKLFSAIGRGTPVPPLCRAVPAASAGTPSRAPRVAGKAGTIGDDSDFHLSRTRRTVDAEGLAKMLELNERHREERDQVELEAAKRREEDGSDAIVVSDGMLLFRVPATRESGRARNA